MRLLLILMGLPTLIWTQEVCRFFESAPRLGTTVSVTFFVACDQDPRDVTDGFFGELDRLNRVISDYDPSSEISSLAKSYRPRRAISISPELFALLQKSDSLSRWSQGRFDITIGPLTQLWRRTLKDDRIPSVRQIRRARRAVGHDHLQLLPPGRLSLRRKHMRFDFGGIGKGFIGDQLADWLRRQGVESFLIDLGGDLIAGAPPPDKAGWTISIPWIDKKMTLAHQSVATSGPDYQFFVHKDRRYSHIIDPTTGWGIDRPHSSTIVAPQGWLADGLASAAALLPPAQTLALLDSLPDVNGMFGIGGELFQSSGFYLLCTP